MLTEALAAAELAEFAVTAELIVIVANAAMLAIAMQRTGLHESIRMISGSRAHRYGTYRYAMWSPAAHAVTTSCPVRASRACRPGSDQLWLLAGTEW